MVGDKVNNKLGSGPEIAFTPTYMFTVAGAPDAKGRATQKVLLGRSGFEDHGFLSYPLLFDPDRPMTEAAVVEMSSGAGAKEIDMSGDGVVYYTELARHDDMNVYRICAVPLPGGKRTDTGALVSHGEFCLRFHDGRLNVVMSRPWAKPGQPAATAEIESRWEWWQYDPATKKSRLMAANFIPVQSLAVSAHYGFVALRGWMEGGPKTALFTVAIENPAPGTEVNPIQNPPRNPNDPDELKLRWTSALNIGQYAGPLLFVPEAGVVLFASNPSAETDAFGAIDLATGRRKPDPFADGPKRVQEFYALGAFRFGTRSRDEDRIRIWNLKTGKADGEIAIPEVPQAKAREGNHMHVRLSPDGKYLVAARGGFSFKPFACPFRLIDTATGKAVLSFDWTGGTTHFTADSSRVLLAECSGKFRWFKLPSGEADGGWEFTEADGRGVMHDTHGISADGRAVVYSGPAKTLRNSSFCVLDGKTGEVVRRDLNHGTSPGTVISADNRLVAGLRKYTPGQTVLDIIPATEGAPVGRATVPTKGYGPSSRLSADGRTLLVFDASGGKMYLFEVPADRSPAPPK